MEVPNVLSAAPTLHPGFIRLGLVSSFVAALEGIAAWMAVHAPEIDVVMQVTTWGQAAKEAAARPNVLLVDAQSLTGALSDVRIASARARGVAIVVLGDNDNDALASELLGAGVARVLGKHASLQESKSAVIDAALATVEPRVVQPIARAMGDLDGEARRALSMLGAGEVAAGAAAIVSAATVSANAPHCDRLHQRLTEADIEAVRLYAQGQSPIDIALHMNVRFDRVRDHLAHVRGHYARQGRRALSRLDLVQRVIEDGLLEA